MTNLGNIIETKIVHDINPVVFRVDLNYIEELKSTLVRSTLENLNKETERGKIISESEYLYKYPLAWAFSVIEDRIKKSNDLCLFTINNEDRKAIYANFILGQMKLISYDLRQEELFHNFLRSFHNSEEFLHSVIMYRYAAYVYMYGSEASMISKQNASITGRIPDLLVRNESGSSYFAEVKMPKLFVPIIKDGKLTAPAIQIEPLIKTLEELIKKASEQIGKNNTGVLVIGSFIDRRKFISAMGKLLNFFFITYGLNYKNIRFISLVSPLITDTFQEGEPRKNLGFDVSYYINPHCLQN